jgi:hypothetical protein
MRLTVSWCGSRELAHPGERRRQAQSDHVQRNWGQWLAGSGRLTSGDAARSDFQRAWFITRWRCSAVTCAQPRTTPGAAPGGRCVQDKDRLQSRALCLSEAARQRRGRDTASSRRVARFSLYTLCRLWCCTNTDAHHHHLGRDASPSSSTACAVLRATQATIKFYICETVSKDPMCADPLCS